MWLLTRSSIPHLAFTGSTYPGHCQYEPAPCSSRLLAYSAMYHISMSCLLVHSAPDLYDEGPHAIALGGLSPGSAARTTSAQFDLGSWK